MSNDPESVAKHGEIIIVKRVSGDHDDGHHGGVWKIAFADFMTAMMAFFLVMWLINASNEETKRAVASYFNPIKLTDRTSNPRGVLDPKYGDVQKDAEKDVNETASTMVSGAKMESARGTSQQSFDEQALFVDPYAVLAEIAGGMTASESGEGQAGQAETSGESGRGISGGAAFHDPFDPSSWTTTFRRIRETPPDDPNAEVVETPLEELELSDMRLSVVEEAPPEADATAETPVDETERPVNPEHEAIILAVKEAVDAVVLPDGPPVEVKSTGEGVLISLTDDLDFGMFDVGSAKPRPELVVLMAELGGALAEHDKPIIIAGHTDARRYTSGQYDNWRLSTARAHLSMYMLARGGMPEELVRRIEGHGFTQLKEPDDPFSAKNRRIEILVVTE